MSDEVFMLTQGERNSALWRKLLEHLQNKLATARAQNDGPHDAAATATLRGQISTLKALIALDEEPVVQ